jgi:hypothetical protein
VAPDPLTFAQINTDYWDVHKYNKDDPNWLHLGYNVPPGCNLTTDCDDKSSMMEERNVTFCQVKRLERPGHSNFSCNYVLQFNLRNILQ